MVFLRQFAPIALSCLGLLALKDAGVSRYRFSNPLAIPTELDTTHRPQHNAPSKPLFMLSGMAVLDHDGNVWRILREESPKPRVNLDVNDLATYLEQDTGKAVDKFKKRYSWVGRVDSRALGWARELIVEAPRETVVSTGVQCVDCNLFLTIFAYQGSQPILLQSEGEVGKKRIGPAAEALVTWFNGVLENFLASRVRFRGPY